MSRDGRLREIYAHNNSTASTRVVVVWLVVKTIPKFPCSFQPPAQRSVPGAPARVGQCALWTAHGRVFGHSRRHLRGDDAVSAG